MLEQGKILDIAHLRDSTVSHGLTAERAHINSLLAGYYGLEPSSALYTDLQREIDLNSCLYLESFSISTNIGFQEYHSVYWKGFLTDCSGGKVWERPFFFSDFVLGATLTIEHQRIEEKRKKRQGNVGSENDECDDLEINARNKYLPLLQERLIDHGWSIFYKVFTDFETTRAINDKLKVDVV